MSAKGLEKSRAPQVTRGVFGLAVLLVLTMAAISVRRVGASDQSPPPVASAATQTVPPQEANSRRGTTAKEDSRKESSLRIQLQQDPHDKAAYEELRELVEGRDERGLLNVVETWMAHNSPDWETMLHLNTTAVMGLDDPEEAIREERLYLKRTARQQDYGDTWDSVETWLAENLLSRGHNQEALAHFQHQAAVMKRASEWCVLGDAELGLGLVQQSIGSYERALELEPDYESAHAGLSRAYATLRDFPHAETEARASISLARMEVQQGSKYPGYLSREGHHPTLARRYRSLAWLYATEGSRRRAIEEEISAEKSDTDDFEAGMIKAMLYDQMGEPARSKAVIYGIHNQLLGLISQDKSSKEFSGMVSRAENVLVFEDSSRQNHDQDAIAAAIWYLEPQLREGTLKPVEQFTLGERYCEVGRVDECKKLELAAMQAVPDFDKAKLEHSLGLAFAKAGRVPDVKEHFRVAYELAPQNLTYRMDYEATDRGRLPEGGNP